MKTDVVEEFIKLASLNSPSRREGQVAGYLLGRLREMGLTPVVDNSAPLTGSDTGNIIARVAGNAEGPAILLCAHMDTVGPTEGMVPVVRDGVIYSNGKTVLGADDKAGIAIIMAAVAELMEDGEPHGPIELLFTVQEEIGLFGARFLQADLQADFGYIADGDGQVGNIVTMSPSKIDLDFTIEGKAAHAARPEQGINAVVVAAAAIARLTSGRIDEDTTMNIGVISGGKARNIVPDNAEVAIEIRGFNIARLEEEVLRTITVFNEEAAKSGAVVKVRRELNFETFNIPHAHPVVANALRAAAVAGIEPQFRKSGGGMDANIFNGRGLTCIGLGFGAERMHSPDESIPVSQLREGTRFVKALLTAAVQKQKG
jgi:tripeptide aminopeptidase